MSGGIPELGGMKMVNFNKKDNIVIIICAICFIATGCYVFFIDHQVYVLNEEINSLNYSSDFNVLKNNQQVLFNSQLALADKQKAIVNACGLKSMIQEGCVISNQTQIDVNTSAVTLLCPIKQEV